MNTISPKRPMNQERFFENFMLGVTTGQIPVDERSLNIAAVHKLASSATIQMNIVSRKLDHFVFDHIDIVEAISNFIRRASHTKVRILVFNSIEITKSSHRLLALAHRAPSKMALRLLSPEYKDFNESFVTADKTGYLHNQQSDLYDGVVSFNDPIRCSELNKTFNEIWDRSVEDPNLRQLKI